MTHQSPTYAAYKRGYQNGQATLEARCKAAYGRGFTSGVMALLAAELVLVFFIFLLVLVPS